MTDEDLLLLIELEDRFNEWCRTTIACTLILCVGMVVDAVVYRLITWAIS